MTIAATRRTFLTSAGAWTMTGLAAPQAIAAPDIKVTLLGTKVGPRVNKGRANPSNLVTAAGQPYVVDCGYGVTRQLVDAGVEAHEVRTILITHNHSDHVLELGPLVYSAWVGGMREPIDVSGQQAVGKSVAHFLDSVGYDIDIRMEDEGRPDLRKLVG